MTANSGKGLPDYFIFFVNIAHFNANSYLKIAAIGCFIFTGLPLLV